MDQIAPRVSMLLGQRGLTDHQPSSSLDTGPRVPQPTSNSGHGPNVTRIRIRKIAMHEFRPPPEYSSRWWQEQRIAKNILAIPEEVSPTTKTVGLRGVDSRRCAKPVSSEGTACWSPAFTNQPQRRSFF